MKIAKPILVIITVALVFSSTALGQNIEVSIPDSSARPGDVVTIPVNIGNTTGRSIIAAEMVIEYTPQVLNFMDASTSGTIAEGWQIFTDAVPGRITIIAAGANDLVGTGALVQMRFTVQPNLRTGVKSQITFSEVILNEGVPNAVPSPGTFTVGDAPPSSRLEGDVNGDDRVDRKDLLMLILAYNKSIGDTAYNPLADFDSDGRINRNDVVILLKNYGAVR